MDMNGEAEYVEELPDDSFLDTSLETDSDELVIDLSRGSGNSPENDTSNHPDKQTCNRPDEHKPTRENTLDTENKCNVNYGEWSDISEDSSEDKNVHSQMSEDNLVTQFPVGNQAYTDFEIDLHQPKDNNNNNNIQNSSTGEVQRYNFESTGMNLCPIRTYATNTEASDERPQNGSELSNEETLINSTWDKFNYFRDQITFFIHIIDEETNGCFHDTSCRMKEARIAQAAQSRTPPCDLEQVSLLCSHLTKTKDKLRKICSSLEGAFYRALLNYEILSKNSTPDNRPPEQSVTQNISASVDQEHPTGQSVNMSNRIPPECLSLFDDLFRGIEPGVPKEASSTFDTDRDRSEHAARAPVSDFRHNVVRSICTDIIPQCPSITQEEPSSSSCHQRSYVSLVSTCAVDQSSRGLEFMNNSAETSTLRSSYDRMLNLQSQQSAIHPGPSNMSPSSDVKKLSRGIQSKNSLDLQQSRRVSNRNNSQHQHQPLSGSVRQHNYPPGNLNSPQIPSDRGVSSPNQRRISTAPYHIPIVPPRRENANSGGNLTNPYPFNCITGNWETSPPPLVPIPPNFHPPTHQEQQFPLPHNPNNMPWLSSTPVNILQAPRTPVQNLPQTPNFRAGMLPPVPPDDVINQMAAAAIEDKSIVADFLRFLEEDAREQNNRHQGQK